MGLGSSSNFVSFERTLERRGVAFQYQLDQENITQAILRSCLLMSSCCFVCACVRVCVCPLSDCHKTHIIFSLFFFMSQYIACHLGQLTQGWHKNQSITTLLSQKDEKTTLLYEYNEMCSLVTHSI